MQFTFISHTVYSTIKKKSSTNFLGFITSCNMHLFYVVENAEVEWTGKTTHHGFVVGGASSDGRPVWIPGPPDLVGLLLGYHGTCHLLRDLRHHHGNVCLFCSHKTGDYRCYFLIQTSTSFPRAKSYKLSHLITNNNYHTYRY